jgi:antirestriction protein ArdC
MADSIGMPPFESFHNSFKHSESILHELIHWTGHTSRLNRLHVGWTNKTDYSKEELVACLGSALMLNHLGVETTEEMELNQTAYLQGWISHLKNDMSILLDASIDAVNAANYLIKLHEGKDENRVQAA